MEYYFHIKLFKFREGNGVLAKNKNYNSPKGKRNNIKHDKSSLTHKKGFYCRRHFYSNESENSNSLEQKITKFSKKLVMLLE